MGVHAYVYLCMCTHMCSYNEKLSLQFIYMLPERHGTMRSCDRAYVLLLFLVEVRVCVFLSEQLLTGAGELRLIKLQGGCAGITFTSCRKNYHKKRVRPGWAKLKLGCPVMSNMWCYLRPNPQSLGTVPPLEYCDLNAIALVGSERETTLLRVRGQISPEGRGICSARHSEKSDPGRRNTKKCGKQSIPSSQRSVTRCPLVSFMLDQKQIQTFWDSDGCQIQGPLSNHHPMNT